MNIPTFKNELQPIGHCEGLPVYPTDAVIWKGDSFTERMQSHSGRIVLRQVSPARQFGTEHIDSLVNLTNIADAEFERACTFWNARVVGHTYGLSRLPAGITSREERPWAQQPVNMLVPRGYGLVARVEVLRRIVQDPGAISRARRLGHEYYSKENSPPGTVCWSDMGSDQFVFNKPSLRSDRELVMIDPDPRLKRRRTIQEDTTMQAFIAENAFRFNR